MNFKPMTCGEAQPKIDNAEVVVVDIRSSESFAGGCIPKAKHLSIANLESFCHLTDHTKPILVYCHHGISSQSVAQHLVEQGFTSVYSLVGGYEAWQEHHTKAE